MPAVLGNPYASHHEPATLKQITTGDNQGINMIYTDTSGTNIKYECVHIK